MCLGVFTVAERLEYPSFPKDKSHSYVIHGESIEDCFGGLGESNSRETKEFVAKQRELTDQFLKTCETWDKLNEKFTEAIRQENEEQHRNPKRFRLGGERHRNPKRFRLGGERHRNPKRFRLGGERHRNPKRFRLGGKSWCEKNTGLQDQDVLYIKENGKEKVLLDPNELGKDGTSFALKSSEFSKDAKYFAYGLTANGSDWQTIKVMRIDDEKVELDDTLKWVKRTEIAWTHDNKGFFYSCYPSSNGAISDPGNETDANINQELRYHFLGTEQSEDILCWKDPDNPTHTFLAWLTDKGKVLKLLTTGSRYGESKVYSLDLSELRGGLEAFRVENELLPFRFPGSAPNALHKAAANDPQLRDSGTGSLQYQIPPDIGFTSFLAPESNYQYDWKTEAPDAYDWKTEAADARENAETYLPRPTEFCVLGVVIPCKSGTCNIVLRIMHRWDTLHKGPHPCLLHGYGGFGTMPKSFSPEHEVLVRHLGAIVCIAQIRGDGVEGKVHKEGTLANKQDSIDDFHAAAEYLISEGYTESKKLCIEGKSNGGLLVMACVNQRPDLYACALAHNGVMDMLNFHKFTIGHQWIREYGCSEIEDEFRWLWAYSPLHNVKIPWEKSPDCQYPAIMLLIADHDGRVVPLHSLKLLATMQDILCTSSSGTASRQTNPIIMRMEQNAGHGHGLPTRKKIQQAADRYSFMAKMLGAIYREKY